METTNPELFDRTNQFHQNKLHEPEYDYVETLYVPFVRQGKNDFEQRDHYYKTKRKMNSHKNRFNNKILNADRFIFPYFEKLSAPKSILMNFNDLLTQSNA